AETASGGSAARSGFEEACQEFAAAIQRWQERNGDRRDLVEVLDEKGRNYEQRINDFEFEMALQSLRENENAELVREYEQAHAAFEEAEAQCEALRGPYEEALQSAQHNYEAKRQEYLRVVEEIREQLDKAPDE